jgi:hypothetical protein
MLRETLPAPGRLEDFAHASLFEIAAPANMSVPAQMNFKLGRTFAIKTICGPR